LYLQNCWGLFGLQAGWHRGGAVFHAFEVVCNAVEDQAELFGRDKRAHNSDADPVESAISRADL
jgi:hypothetical protein